MTKVALPTNRLGTSSSSSSSSLSPSLIWCLQPSQHYPPTVWDLFLSADLFLSRHFVGETRILRHLATLVSWHRRILPTFLFISKSRLIALAKRFKWQKKSIKNHQARIPKIWMPMDSKIRKAGVKYSNDKSFRAPHSRVNIWNPLRSKRQISAWYL